MRLLIALLACLIAFSGLSSPASAQGSPDSAAIESVIREQLDAFGHDDGAKAWSYAAPNIQMLFPDPESFMAMVKKGYPPVYRPKSYEFGPLEQKDGQLKQSVEIVGPDGDYWTAEYIMARQPDGSWKITACHLIRSQGSAA